MSRQRKDTVEYRNIRLKLETYDRLDKYLLMLIRDLGDHKLTLDDAVKSLLEKAKVYDNGSKRE
jgi:hypothetical protein